MPFSFLSEPFPLTYSGKRQLGIAFVSGLFVAFFLIVFQPFGTYEWQNPWKVHLLAGYGIVTFLVLVLNGWVLKRVFRRYYREENWTVGKEIIHLIFTILAIGTCNYLYSGLSLPQFSVPNFRWSAFLWMLSATFLIGLFPSVGITWFNYTRLQKRFGHPDQPKSLSAAELKSDQEQMVTLTAENGRDQLTIPASEFLFLMAADNYTEVWFLKEGEVQKCLLRSSLSRLESEISIPFLVRCHRSYLVNLHQVGKVSGNAQGYKLTLKQGDFRIPVGRSLSDKVMQALNAR